MPNVRPDHQKLGQVVLTTHAGGVDALLINGVPQSTQHLTDIIVQWHLGGHGSVELRYGVESFRLDASDVIITDYYA